jgi:hypothetical protein
MARTKQEHSNRFFHGTKLDFVYDAEIARNLSRECHLAIVPACYAAPPQA